MGKEEIKKDEMRKEEERVEVNKDATQEEMVAKQNDDSPDLRDKSINRTRVIILATILGIVALVIILVFVDLFQNGAFEQHDSRSKNGTDYSYDKEENEQSDELEDGGDEDRKNAGTRFAQERERVFAERAANIPENERNAVKEMINRIVSGLDVGDLKETNGLPFYKPKELNTYINMEYAYSMVVHEEMEVLKSHVIEAGFSPIGEVFLPGEQWAYENYIYNDDIICSLTSLVSQENYPNAFLVCANVDWILLTDEEIVLMSDLENAFYEKNGEYPIYLHSYPRIEDSLVTPYQRAYVDGPDTGFIFYRADKDSDWVYVLAGECFCDELDTEAKKGLAGEECWDETLNKNVQIVP